MLVCGTQKQKSIHKECAKIKLLKHTQNEYKQKKKKKIKINLCLEMKECVNRLRKFRTCMKLYRNSQPNTKAI